MYLIESMRIIKSEKKTLKSPQEQRKAKGYDLFVKGKVMYEDLKNYLKFKVRCSNGNGEMYTIDLKERSCTCPDYSFRLLDCKHIYAAIYARHEAGYLLDFSRPKLESEFTP